MNTMSKQTSATVRAVMFAISTIFATATVNAAEVEKKEQDEQQQQAEAQRKLEDARRRLDAAAREVTELTMSMSERAVPGMRHITRFGPPRAMLGINLGSRGDDAEGVAVASVSPGGAAESSGLKAGDVLLAIGDKQLKREGELSPREVLLREMGEVKPGDKVQLRYKRDNKVATATVTATAPVDRLFATAPFAFRTDIGPAGFTAAAPFPPIAMMRAVGVFGSTELVPVTPKLGQYFGTDKGLLVVRAPADSRLKLEEGDVIVDIDGRTPTSSTHAFRILGSYQSGEKLKLSVLRMKKRVTFDVTIPEGADEMRVNPFQFNRHREDLDGPESGIGVGGEPVIRGRIQGLHPALPPLPPPGAPGAHVITINDDTA